MNQEKLIEKIKKLLALASNNPNPHEAEVAMKRAHKLLRENDLEMSSLADLDSEEVDSEIRSTPQTPPWIRSIYGAVSDLYHCQYLYSSPPFGRHIVIGSTSNRTTAILIIDFLIKTIKKKSNYVYHTQKFLNGAALGVSETCYWLISEEKKNKQEVIPGTGLVPCDIREARELSNQNFIDAVFKVNEATSRSTEYSKEGYDFGSKLSVNPQVEKSSQKALIIT